MRELPGTIDLPRDCGDVVAGRRLPMVQEVRLLRSSLVAFCVMQGRGRGTFVGRTVTAGRNGIRVGSGDTLQKPGNCKERAG